MPVESRVDNNADVRTSQRSGFVQLLDINSTSRYRRGRIKGSENNCQLDPVTATPVSELDWRQMKDTRTVMFVGDN